MPIDYKKYPANWLSEIRPRILARENNCCKFCGIQNGLLGWRVPSGSFYTVADFAGSTVPPADEIALAAIVAKKETL